MGVYKPISGRSAVGFKPWYAVFQSSLTISPFSSTSTTRLRSGKGIGMSYCSTLGSEPPVRPPSKISTSTFSSYMCGLVLSDSPQSITSQFGACSYSIISSNPTSKGPLSGWIFLYSAYSLPNISVLHLYTELCPTINVFCLPSISNVYCLSTGNTSSLAHVSFFLPSKKPNASVDLLTPC